MLGFRSLDHRDVVVPILAALEPELAAYLPHFSEKVFRVMYFVSHVFLPKATFLESPISA